jgi:hypothetical protein
LSCVKAHMGYRPTLQNPGKKKKRPKGALALNKERSAELFMLLRKEVIQPHLPVQLPCYDLAPVMSLTLGACLWLPATSGKTHSHGLTGGVYKARERIHRGMADPRLLAIPASWGRVADPNPN